MDCIERIIRISNMYYNQGLERAQVRDLSGAAESLRKSLKFYKGNTQARNLLGLVYFEMGETVDALSQWVISRSLNPENNGAEEYLKAAQTQGNKLNSLNLTIKKYNQALLYCKQGSKDLAVIQLKKVLALNPRLVKGHQLLALLYMEEGRYDLAKRSLRNAGRIDANNTTTLRYLREVNIKLHGELPSKTNSQKEQEELMVYQSGNETIIRPATFKDNSTFLTILNIIVGVVIGILITWFLVVPSVKQKAVSQANESVRDAHETISIKNQAIKDLENQLAELEDEMEQMESTNYGTQEVIEIYEQLFTAYDAYLAQNMEGAGAALEKVDPEVLTGKASEIYQNISTHVNAQYIVLLYQQGEAAYQSQNYQEAASNLQKVVDIDETYRDYYAVYYLAQSYRHLNQKEEAILYYEKVIEQRPGTERANTARKHLDDLQQIPG